MTIILQTDYENLVVTQYYNATASHTDEEVKKMSNQKILECDKNI